jgi:hypothetical protein
MRAANVRTLLAILAIFCIGCSHKTSPAPQQAQAPPLQTGKGTLSPPQTTQQQEKSETPLASPLPPPSERAVASSSAAQKGEAQGQTHADQAGRHGPDSRGQFRRWVDSIWSVRFSGLSTEQCSATAGDRAHRGKFAYRPIDDR